MLPGEIARLCPQLDLSDKPTRPIVGALYHALGGIIRHDAVVWGLARGADRGVVSATAGWSTLVCGLGGVRLPITTHILQASSPRSSRPKLRHLCLYARS